MKHLKKYNEDNTGPVDEKSYQKNINLIKDVILKYQDSGEIVSVLDDDVSVYYNAQYDGISVSIWNKSKLASEFSFKIYMEIKKDLERFGFKYVNELIVKDTRMVFTVKPKYELRPLEK